MLTVIGRNVAINIEVWYQAINTDIFLGCKIVSINDVEFLNRLLMFNPALRFSGLVEKSGHLNASVIREGVSEHLQGRNPEISYSQSAYIVDLRKIFENELGILNSVIYIYDKVIMFSVPIRNHIVVISADPKRQEFIRFRNI